LVWFETKPDQIWYICTVWTYSNRSINQSINQSIYLNQTVKALYKSTYLYLWNYQIRTTFRKFFVRLANLEQWEIWTTLAKPAFVRHTWSYFVNFPITDFHKISPHANRCPSRISKKICGLSDDWMDKWTYMYLNGLQSLPLFCAMYGNSNNAANLAPRPIEVAATWHDRSTTAVLFS